MEPDIVQANKEMLLGALARPENFNEWLQGKHYSAQYVSLLERTENACSQSVRASNAAMAAATKTHHRPPPVTSPPRNDAVHLLSKSRKQQQLELQQKQATLEAKPLGSLESGEMGGAECPSPPTAGSKEDATKESSTRAPKARPAKDHNHEVVDGENLDSAGIRDHLRESYYHMKAANAFGNTFPALLTPFNRSVFHVYDEDELPNRRGGIVYPKRIVSHTNSSRASGKTLEEWQDMTKGWGGRSYDYPYQNEVLNETCLRNLLVQPGGPPAFYPVATRPKRKQDDLLPFFQQ